MYWQDSPGGSGMTKLEQAVHREFMSVIDGHLVDGFDKGGWILELGDQDLVVEYLPADKDHHPRVTLADPNCDEDDYRIKHKFIVKLEITEVDLEPWEK